MKKFCIIIILIAIGYISCLTDINDISLSTEILINEKEFPNNTLSINSIFYFRLEIADKNEKLIKLKADKNDSFIIKIAQTEEKPEIQDIDLDKWNELEPQKSANDSKYYIHFYHFQPEENKKYILISVGLKNDLNNFSFYIENDEPEIDEIITIQAEYSKEYQVNLTESKSKHPKLIIELNENYLGETFLNFIVNHKDKDSPIDFRLFAIGYESNSENCTNIELNDISEPGNTIHKYSFYSEKKLKKIYIKVELSKKINFAFHLNYTKNIEDKIINIYNVDYSKYYNMKDALYGPDKSRNIILKPRNKYIGDVHIISKVDSNALDDDLKLEVYGAEEPGEKNKVRLEVKYNKIYYEGNYNIIDYYFKSDNKTAFFTVETNIPNYKGYLSMKVDNQRYDYKGVFYSYLRLVGILILISILACVWGILYQKYPEQRKILKVLGISAFSIFMYSNIIYLIILLNS